MMAKNNTRNLSKIILMLKIGVFGAGHLGKIHIRLLLELKETFEFVGSGTSVFSALPRNGGDLLQVNETVSSNGGIVYFTSTDQFGNFRIGEDLLINFNTGTLSGRAFTRSLFAQITPFVLALDS